jgi:metallophosphoesterase (TIGR00282 family)
MVTNILFVGDVVGRPGRRAVLSRLPDLIVERAVDFVIVNGENAADGVGITPRIVASLAEVGVDVITTGNHIWARREICRLLEISERIIRPANYPDETPGRPLTVRTARNGEAVAVINVCGGLFMDCGRSPFTLIDDLVEKAAASAPHIVVDLHAEATSEKMAMGHHLAGRVTAVLGTHTHVQTADQTILESATAYITDVGMSGPLDSVIGMSKDVVLHNHFSGQSRPPEVADGPVRLDYVVVGSEGGRAVSIERVQEKLR